MRTSLRTNSAKILASVVLVGGAASVAGLGTFGTFTSTTSASEAVSTGKVVLGTGATVKALAIPATGMVPGDTVQRALTLTRSSDSEKFGSLTLTTTAVAGANTGTSGAADLLTSNITDGLRLTVDQCATAWTKAATTEELLCSGATTNVLTNRAAVQTLVDLPVATTTLNTAGATSFLRVQLALPTNAGNDFQGKSSTVSFVFDATQRGADFR